MKIKCSRLRKNYKNIYILQFYRFLFLNIAKTFNNSNKIRMYDKTVSDPNDIIKIYDFRNKSKLNRFIDVYRSVIVFKYFWNESLSIIQLRVYFIATHFNCNCRHLYQLHVCIVKKFVPPYFWQYVIFYFPLYL